MHTIDWILFVTPVVLMLSLAIYTRQFVRGVADFLAAGRCAGRYLLCNAKGESASGVANTMGKFESIMLAGFTFAFWDQMSVPILLLVSVSGFVIYRYRETRSLTVSQFLEMRYSRSFRIFMGAMAFIAGVLNYGIFPAVSARFFIYFLGMPQVVHVGSLSVSTVVPVMAVLMSCSVTLLLFGGQVALLLTDCIEGVISHLVYMIVVVVIFMTVSWSEIVKVCTDLPKNHSMLNPFDAWDVSDFNVWYVIISLILTIYGTMAFQTSNGTYAAAKTPHESRMSGILGHWRGYARSVMLLIVTLGAVAFMKHPDFAAASKPAHEVLASVSGEQTQSQVTIPIALRFLLPVGVKGLFCGIMIMGLMANDVVHISTWSGIFIQDVVLPLCKNQPSPREHLRWLRCSVAGVAIFAFLFSAFYHPTQHIMIYMNVSAGVFMTGAGATIIGGLYWKRGTTGAAWASMITGATLTLTILFFNQWWSSIAPHLRAATGRHLPAKFPISGMPSLFYCSCVAAGVYVLWSVLTSRETFNLNHMLHRDGTAPSDHAVAPLAARRSILSRIFGFDEHFTRNDKWVTVLMMGWSLLIAAVNIGVCAWNAAIHPLSVNWWAGYWRIVGIGVPMIIAVVSLIWFTIGTAFDVRDFFHILRTKARDARDNGQVTRAEHESMHDEVVGSVREITSATASI